jgi:hypothetical protein
VSASLRSKVSHDLLSAISMCGSLKVWNVEKFCPDRVCGESGAIKTVSHEVLVSLVGDVTSVVNFPGRFCAYYRRQSFDVSSKMSVAEVK